MSGKRSFGAAEAFVLLLGLVPAVLFVWVVAMRLTYRIDDEWMTGAVRESVERVRDGKTFYGPPSAEFVPFLYPPIYYWLAGLLAHVTSSFVAAKGISLLATAATVWGITRVCRAMGASPFWSIAAGMLHLATYAHTLFFFDLERVDATEAAMVMLGLLVLVGGKQAPDEALDRNAKIRAACGGLILGLAFFAKQPALLIFLAAIAGLAISGQGRRALWAFGAGALGFVALFAYMRVTTGGWFYYYALKLPGAHGIELALVTVFFCIDVPHVFFLAGGTIGFLAPLAPKVLKAIFGRRLVRDVPWRDVLFGAILLAGFLGAFSLRSHRGGWANVIIAWTPLGCAAAGIAASRLQALAAGGASGPATRAALLTAVGLQFVSGFFDPFEVSPTRGDVENRDKLIAFVRKLETKGEVIVTTTGEITSKPHFNAAAMYDIIRANDPAPAELVAGIKSGSYAGIIGGAPVEFDCDIAACKQLVDLLKRYYYVSTRMPEVPHTGMVGFDARPRWVLRPRKHPLVDASKREVDRRQRAEIGIAEHRSMTAKPNAEPDLGDDIEELAALEAARAPAPSSSESEDAEKP